MYISVLDMKAYQLEIDAERVAEALLSVTS
jgi:hypothetical protein